MLNPGRAPTASEDDDFQSEVEPEGALGDESEEDAPQGQHNRLPPDTMPQEERQPKAIFIGHGKKAGPLDKLEKILAGFQIPYKVAVSEPNLGRPIPKKVKDLMVDCGSAILIFTRDERFVDPEGNEIWRPSVLRCKNRWY